MQTLKIVIEAKIATAEENLIKEEIKKLFDTIFNKPYAITSRRINEEDKNTIVDDLDDFILEAKQLESETSFDIHVKKAEQAVSALRQNKF